MKNFRQSHIQKLIQFTLILLMTCSFYTAADSLEKPSIEQPISEHLTDVQVKNVININVANEKQLASLKGIGKSKAKAIIEYRQANGPFTEISQLLQIEGIGKTILERNSQRLSI